MLTLAFQSILEVLKNTWKSNRHSPSLEIIHTRAEEW